MNNLSAYLLGILTAVPILLLVAWWSLRRVKKRFKGNLSQVINKIGGKKQYELVS